MISRSFGLNIGAAIGIALFFAQAVSVAFYVIAFGEAFDPVLEWVSDMWGLVITKKMIGLSIMALLTLLMMTKGANIGLKALYFVVGILGVSLVFFFLGHNNYQPHGDYNDSIVNSDSFIYVFAIIFPAFTGIAAGLGLSGDLKEPRKSIPKGTFWATIVGMLVYVAVAFKLYYSASPSQMANNQMIMGDIAIWGPIIPIGLACAAVSSALGSIMIAPRTLQALGVDNIFPGFVSRWFAKGKETNNEPIHATLVTCAIGFAFVAIGGLNFVAELISVFFMVTYGAICSISFLEHFAADPAYRPTFRSRWYFSLFGALICFYLMFKMNFLYAISASVLMGGIYLWVSKVNGSPKGVQHLLKGVIFQLTRELQVYLQKRDIKQVAEDGWRPFVLCITKDTFKRRAALDMLRWLSHRYGFGTYIHYIEGFLDKETYLETNKVKERLIHLTEGMNSRVYLDTVISPSYTSAVAQAIQIPGVSGKGNNMILFEYNKDDPETLKDIVDNYRLLRAAEFDVCILRSTQKGFGYYKEIHIWISPLDFENSNLMILIAYIMLGHPEWKRGTIKIFSIYPEGEIVERKEALLELITAGRLPISSKNIELIEQTPQLDIKAIINQRSADADLSIIGYRDYLLTKDPEVFSAYDDLGNVLFVSAVGEKEIQ